jgi:regulator of nucleoside diphosphate kinase
MINEDYWPDVSMRPALEQLGAALASHVPVAAERVPGDVITLNSQVGLFGLEKGEAFTCTLVLSQTADITQNKISILAPIGQALLGHRVGDVVEYTTPAGLQRLLVTMILYQPEAAGDYDLPEE